MTHSEYLGQDLFIDGGYMFGAVGAVRFQSALSQYVQVPTHIAYDGLEEFSMSMWVRPRISHDGSVHSVIYRDNSWCVLTEALTDIFTQGINIGGNAYSQSSPAFTLDRWYMLSLTYDGATIRYYMNGEEYASESASGTVDTTTSDIFMGYHPTLDVYSDIDLALVQFYEYGLSPTEIDDLYTPPFRLGCLSCYITAGESATMTDSQPCVVVSDASTNNPFTAITSVGLFIATTSVATTQHCFIGCGNDEVVSWDTRIVLDNSQRRSWDNVVLIEGSTNDLNELQLGNVVYPITRDAKRHVRIRNRFDPDKITLHQECWLQTHTILDDLKKSAYISGQLFKQNWNLCFIPGNYNTVTDSQGAYIVNNEVNNNQQVYIRGQLVYPTITMKYVYIPNKAGVLEGSTRLLISGGGTTESRIFGYVSGPFPRNSTRFAHIVGQVSDISEFKKVFVYGNVPARRTQVCYIEGRYDKTDSQLCYMPVIPKIQSTKQCFIRDSHRVENSTNLFVKSHASITSNNLMHLQAQRNVEGNQGAYTAGRGQREGTKRAYIAGPVPSILSSNQGAYVSNSDPGATKLAFIVCGPLTFVRCHIMSQGTATKLKRTYICA
jgi:hypothetical protein